MEDYTVLDVRKSYVLMSLFSLPTHITRPDKPVLKFDLHHEKNTDFELRIWAQRHICSTWSLLFFIIFQLFSLILFFLLPLIKHFISLYLHSKGMVEMLIYLMLTMRRSGRILELYSQNRIWGSINCPFLFIVDIF